MKIAESARKKYIFSFRMREMSILGSVLLEIYLSRSFIISLLPMKWSLICLSSIALVLTSCAHSDQTPAPSTVTPTNTMSSYESALKSLPDAIHSDGAFTECMVRATNMCISTTVLTQVRESRDLKLCDSLIDPGIKSSCRQTAVTLNAREKEDPSICDAL